MPKEDWTPGEWDEFCAWVDEVNHLCRCLLGHETDNLSISIDYEAFEVGLLPSEYVACDIIPQLSEEHGYRYIAQVVGRRAVWGPYDPQERHTDRDLL